MCEFCSPRPSRCSVCESHRPTTAAQKTRPILRPVAAFLVTLAASALWVYGALLVSRMLP